MKTVAPKPRLVIAAYDRAILVVYMVMCFIGLFFMLDISSIGSSMSFFYKHLAFVIISLCAMVWAFRIVDMEKVRHWTTLFVWISILLLALVLVLGKRVNGAVRAFDVPFIHISVQPSEIARVALVLYFAYFLDKFQNRIDDTRPVGFLANFWILIPPTAAIFGLVLLEPHLSTLIILACTLMGMLWLAKIRAITLFLIIFLGLGSVYGIIKFKQDYRSGRVELYKKYSSICKVMGIKPDPTKQIDDYHIRESLTAMASGSLTGTGSVNGKAKYYYLPEASTDYIYAVIGEEYGFLGALGVLLLYLFLFVRSMKVSYDQDSMFLRLAGMGLAMNLFFNALVNIGVAISALPSTGVTLPFISYGGTSFLVNSIAIGMILNISAQRREIW